MRTNGLVSKGLFKNCLRRYWPLCLAYFVVVALLFVAPVYATVGDMITLGNSREDLVSNWMPGLWETARMEGVAFSVVAAIIAAVSLNDHLFDMRAATFVGSLPVRRRTVFATYFLAGLLMLVAVPVAAALCLLPLKVISGGVLNLAGAGTWLVFVIMLTFVFYAVAQVVCQLAGTRPVAVLLYAVANVLVACLETAVRLIMPKVLYGLDNMSLALDWLSPLVGIVSHGVSGWEGDAMDPQWGVLVGYMVAAAVLVVVAAMLYERRNLESAGTSIVNRRMVVVLKYLAGVSTALLFGTIYCVLTTYDIARALPLDAVGVVSLLASMLAGAFVGVVFSQMIMDRSARVWSKVWRGGLVLSGMFAVLLVACKLDVLGVVRRVPAPQEVESVQVGCSFFEAGTFSSEEGIAQACDLQRDILALGITDERDESSGTAFYNVDYVQMTFAYTLKNGNVMTRVYPIETSYFAYLNGETPADEGARIVDRIAALEATPEGRASRFSKVLDSDAKDLRIQFGVFTDSAADYTELSIPARHRQEFVDEGLRPDLMEGKAGDPKAEFGFGEEVTNYGAIYVYDAEYNHLLSVDVSEEHTPHTLAWLREHYPNLDLNA